MSDISNVDGGAPSGASSQPVASASVPVEQPVSTTGPADTAAGEQTQQAQGEHPDKPKRDRSAEKRISRLTQQREAAIREAGYWRGVAESKVPGAEPSADGSPPQQQTRHTPAVDPGEVEHSKSVLDRIRDAGEDSDDVDDVMDTITSDDFMVSRAMRDYLGISEKPYELAKWLTDNPKEAARIARLDSAVAVRALEKAEARLASKPAPVRTTNTPPPPPTVNGRGTPQFNPQTASPDDYAKHWNERRAARSR